MQEIIHIAAHARVLTYAALCEIAIARYKMQHEGTQAAAAYLRQRHWPLGLTVNILLKRGYNVERDCHEPA